MIKKHLHKYLIFICLPYLTSSNFYSLINKNNKQEKPRRIFILNK